MTKTKGGVMGWTCHNCGHEHQSLADRLKARGFKPPPFMQRDGLIRTARAIEDEELTALRAQIAVLEKDNDDIHELVEHYREALQKIAEPTGRNVLDPLIESMQSIARTALGWPRSTHSNFYGEAL